jgi:uncharacterized OB-fold protein
MAGIRSAAVYLPGFTDGRRRRAAADEDEFTMLATAIERLPLPSEGPAGSVRLFAVGDVSTRGEEALGWFLGSSSIVERCGTGLAALERALSGASQTDAGGPSEVVALVELSRGPPTAARGSDGAIALWVAPDGPLPVDSLEVTDPRTDVDTLRRRLLAMPAAGPVRADGDWEVAVEKGRPFVPVDRAALEPSPMQPVSQGAYVAKARYRESVSARWHFTAERCGICGGTTFPPQGRCRSCEATERLDPVRLPKDGGRVVAATVIRPGGQPTEFDEPAATRGPYGVVLVELEAGARVTLPVADADATPLPVGTRVATRMRRIYPMEGEWRYGRKALPFPSA